MLDAETVEALTFDLLGVQDQADLDEFVGKLVRTVRRAAKKTVADIGDTKLAKTVGKAAAGVAKGIATVGSAVPAVGTIVKLASRSTPLGALARSTYGALAAALRGQNIVMGALDGLEFAPGWFDTFELTTTTDPTETGIAAGW